MSSSFQKYFMNLWKEQDKIDTYKNVSETKLEGLIQLNNQKNENTRFPEIETWIEIYDQHLIWAVTLNSIVFVEKDEWNPRVKTFYFLLGAIISQMTAIRNLVLAGLDMPAKQVLRSYVEYCNLLVFLSFREELIGDFLETENLETTNNFWHKYLSKEKLRKFVRNEINKLIGHGHNDFSNYDYEIQEDAILSAAAHPSFIASLAATAPILFSFEGDTRLISPLDALGIKSALSERTLHYTLHSFYLILTVAFSNLFLSSNPLIKYDKQKEFHDYVFSGRELLAKVSIIIVEKMHENDEKGIREDKISEWFNI